MKEKIRTDEASKKRERVAAVEGVERIEELLPLTLLETLAVDDEVWKYLTKERKENFSKAIETYLKERGIKCPPVKIKILFSGHYYSKDADNLKEAVAGCDIFIPEAVGWSAGDLLWARNKSSDKLLKPASIPEDRKSFKTRFQESYMGSGKEIAYVDLTKTEDEKLVSSRSIQNFYGKLNGQIAYSLIDPKGLPSFETTLENLGNSLKQNAAELKIRNVNMVSNLAPAIEEVLLNNPALQNNKSLDVTMFLGTQHTPVYMYLKKRGENVERDLNYREVGRVLFANSEAERRYEFGKEVSEELLAKNLLIVMYNRNFPDLIDQFESSYEFTEFLKDVMDCFTYDEIKKIYERLSDPAFEQFFDREIKKKNIFPVQWQARKRRAQKK